MNSGTEETLEGVTDRQVKRSQKLMCEFPGAGRKHSQLVAALQRQESHRTRQRGDKLCPYKT